MYIAQPEYVRAKANIGGIEKLFWAIKIKEDNGVAHYLETDKKGKVISKEEICLEAGAVVWEKRARLSAMSGWLEVF